MFEQYTEGFILDRMKQNIDNGIDKKEGTFTHDVLSPSANEVARIYSQMDYAIKQAFLSDASGNYLTKKALEFNVIRKDKQKAVGTVIFHGAEGSVIPAHSIVSTVDGYKFENTETYKISAGATSINIIVEALDYGPQYNVGAYTIRTLNTSVSGITKVENIEPFAGGDNTESDEELRARTFEHISEPIASGNANHYKQWCYEVNGVGAAKVINCGNGAGTVKVIILDSNRHVANSALLTETANHIKDNMTIGVVSLEVVTARIRNIRIMVDMKQLTSVTYEKVIATINERVGEYFNKVAFEKERVSYNKMAALFENLVSEGIIADYRNIRINNLTVGSDLLLDIDEIPELEGVDVNDFN